MQLATTRSSHRRLGLTVTLEWVTLFAICFLDMIAHTKQSTCPQPRSVLQASCQGNVPFAYSSTTVDGHLRGTWDMIRTNLVP